MTAFLQHYVAPGECVVDPFVGSGSTVMGCDALGVTCRAMELSPEYVQLAIDRWEQASGERAEPLGERV